MRVISLSLFALSSFICLSLLSLIYSHGWRYPVMHIYMYQDIHILYRCICMWIILPTFPTAGVVSCLGEVNFSPWNLITHAILIVPIRDLEGTFFHFSSSHQERSRRGYGLSAWLSLSFFLLCQRRFCCRIRKALPDRARRDLIGTPKRNGSR